MLIVFSLGRPKMPNHKLSERIRSQCFSHCYQIFRFLFFEINVGCLSLLVHKHPSLFWCKVSFINLCIHVYIYVLYCSRFFGSRDIHVWAGVLRDPLIFSRPPKVFSCIVRILELLEVQSQKLEISFNIVIKI